MAEGAVILDASDRVDDRGYSRCLAIDCRSCFVVQQSVFDHVALGMQGGDIRSLEAKSGGTLLKQPLC